jgi:hypothetical protein
MSERIEIPASEGFYKKHVEPYEGGGIEITVLKPERFDEGNVGNQIVFGDAQIPHLIRALGGITQTDHRDLEKRFVERNRQYDDLEARLAEKERILGECLSVMPFGNINTHTIEDLPERISELVSVCAKLDLQNEDLQAKVDSLKAQQRPAWDVTEKCVKEWKGGEVLLAVDRSFWDQDTRDNICLFFKQGDRVERTWESLHKVSLPPKSPASIVLALKDKVTLADPDKAIVPVELFKAAVEMAKEANQNA